MAGLEEDVYESGSVNDDKCSLIEEGYWYENDLLLAAELGKTLLERNKDLEYQLTTQAKNSITLRMEIDLLKKQLETLRELNKNKMLLYEDVDRNSHELELSNKSLMEKNRKLKERVNVLTCKTAYLEQQIDDKNYESNDGDELNFSKSGSLTLDIDNLLPQKATLSPYSFSKENYKLTQTSPNEDVYSTGKSSSKGRGASVTYCSECKILRKTNDYLESELELKTVQVESLKENIVALEKQVHRYEVELEDLKSTPIQTENTDIKEGLTKENFLVEDLYNSLEYDIEKVDENPVEVGDLQTGGRVLSSRKSLQTLGVQVGKSEQPNNLLRELESKYNTLVSQYEDLLKLKTKTNYNNNCPNCSLPALSADYNISNDAVFSQKLGNIFSEDTRKQRKLLTTQNYRPKYKELFRDAFDLLKDMKHNNERQQNT